MHLMFAGGSLRDKEPSEWLHRLAWSCMAWMKVNPSKAVYQDGSGSLTIPVMRVVLSAQAHPRLFRFFGSYTPSKMTYVPATLTIRNVSGVRIVGRTPPADAWVVVEPAMCTRRDKPSTIYIGPEEHSLDIHSGIEVDVSDLHIDLIDDGASAGT